MKLYSIIAAVLLSLAGCEQSTHNAAVSASEQAARETTAYKIAALEAGRELPADDKEVLEMARTLQQAAQFFNTTEKEIGNVAYFHAKAAREKGAIVTVQQLLVAGMSAYPAGSPMGTMSLDAFNSFGAMYQVTQKTKVVNAQT